MTLPAMQARDRRAIALGLAILAPALGWVYAGRPAVAALAGLNARVAAAQETLARERAAVAEATRNPARKRVADSALVAVGARVFSGADDVAAGATLATYLGDVARRTHVWLASATTRPPTSASAVSARGAAPGPTVDGVRQLRVELRGESDFQGVLEFLRELERGPKLVTVERLDIARTLRAGEDDSETLSIAATVVGYALTTPAPPAMPAPAGAPGTASARRSGQ